MPLVNGVEISPDDAMAQDRCPECGADLTKIHARSHRNEHWLSQPKNDRQGKEGLRRIALFDKWLEGHPEPEVKE